MISHAAALAHAAASPASTNDITPGVLGFLVIAAMAGALFLLLRSMNKHLRRVRAVRDAGLAPGSDPARAGRASGAAAAGTAGTTAGIADDGTGATMGADQADEAGRQGG